MSIYAFYLDGWEETSTWGEDQDYLYAQINRNGHDDTRGPQYWITPPDYPVVRTTTELAEIIGRITATDVPTVLHTMSAGASLAGASRQNLRQLGLQPVDDG